jgi:hypothetical protein
VSCVTVARVISYSHNDILFVFDCALQRQAVSKHYCIPVAQIRLWPCDRRENGTIRPDRPLEREHLTDTVATLVSASVHSPSSILSALLVALYCAIELPVLLNTWHLL